MKPTQEQLYDAFGELFYALSKVDGEVQESEAIAIEKLLKENTAAEEILWSFEYEFDRNQSVEAAYKKALDVCKWYGASAEYGFLFETLEKIAEASNGISPEERALISNFKTELMEHLQKHTPTQNDYE
jgi:hypothetical protein